jgi:hypothetical protein
MGQKEELLSQMSDEELVKTINSVLIMEGDGDMKKSAYLMIIKEASKRRETTNKELIAFQDYVVDVALKGMAKLQENGKTKKSNND